MKLIRKTIKVDEHNRNVIVDLLANYTVAFLADIPKNAIVTGIIIDGLHLKSVRNIDKGVYVDFYRDDYYDDKRVAAIYHYTFDDDALANLAKSYMLDSFVVEYVETATAEV